MTSDAFVTEIRALHSFLDDWLKGKVEHGDGIPRRLARALADDFVVIHPNGTMGDKESAVNGFARAYGEKGTGYALEIGQIRIRMLNSNLCIAIYEERHRGETGRARIASALLRRQPDGTIKWLHLHESPAPHLENE